MKRLLLALWLAAPILASAQSWPALEVSAGAAHYAKPEDTFWYQQGMPHTMKLMTPALGAAFVGDIYTASRWGVTYRAGYTWFGTMHSDATVVADQNYDEHAHQCVANCGQTEKFVGSGHAQALYLAFGPYVHYGAWRIGVEGGPVWLRNTWMINIASTSAPDTGFTLANKPTWRLGYVIGASVGYGEHLSVAYQFFANKAKSDDPVPYLWRSIHLVSLRYRF